MLAPCPLLGPAPPSPQCRQLSRHLQHTARERRHCPSSSLPRSCSVTRSFPKSQQRCRRVRGQAPPREHGQSRRLEWPTAVVPPPRPMPASVAARAGRTRACACRPTPSGRSSSTRPPTALPVAALHGGRKEISSSPLRVACLCPQSWPCAPGSSPSLPPLPAKATTVRSLWLGTSGLLRRPRRGMTEAPRLQTGCTASRGACSACVKMGVRVLESLN